jgi:hypothetical protein
MSTLPQDYKRIDSLKNNPDYANDYKYNINLKDIKNKENYLFNYGLQTGKRDYVTYYSNKSCQGESDLSETQILIEILKDSKREADEDFTKQINAIINVASDSAIATEKLKNVKYNISFFLDKNLKEYYGYNILSFCDDIVKIGVENANSEYAVALFNKNKLKVDKTKLTKDIFNISAEITGIVDKIGKTMDNRKNIIINGNNRASSVIKNNFSVKALKAYGYDLDEDQREQDLVNIIKKLTSSISVLTAEVDKEIKFNKNIVKTRENDVKIIHTDRKKKLSDLTRTKYIQKYNTVKTENDKFKKTWDGIVNDEFMNDMKGNYNKKYTTYIEFINTCLFYAYYITVVGFAYYLFVHSVSSVIFSVICIIFFILFPFFIHSLEILIYNGASLLMAMVYGTVYTGNDGKTDEIKTPMVYSDIKPPLPV